jgi:hypothetical protein
MEATNEHAAWAEQKVRELLREAIDALCNELRALVEREP